MKCFVHRDSDAVGICVQCGKGICADCAGISASGCQVCSGKCSRGRAAQRDVVNGYFLYSLGAVFGAAAVYYLAAGLWQISMFLGIAAFCCYWNGVRAELQRSGLTAIDYRTGDAMEKVHKLRPLLEELLTLCARRSGAPISLAQLDAADEPGQARLLEQIYGDIRKQLGKKFQPDDVQARARADARKLQFCRRLAEAYFEEHAHQLKSATGRSRVERRLWDEHLRLRDYIAWLSDLNQQLMQHVEQGHQG